MTMRRREFIAGFAGVAAWPLAARAQQPAIPVIGLLNSSVAEDGRERLAAFHRGLADEGFVEGRNVVIEQRAAENHYDRLPVLVDEFVRHRSP
jgi:putative tryptophan/tyrosine transport system substrate-binding protein